MTPRAWIREIGLTTAMAAGLWALIALTGNLVRLIPGWPPGSIAILTAVAAELLLLLYRYESRNLGRRRARQLTGLRLAALGLLTWILMEPTLVRSVKHKLDRQVVVLLDQSASMDLTDSGAAASHAELAAAGLKQSGLLEKLAEHVRVREIPFARSPAEGDASHAGGWKQATDIAAALDTVLDQIPPDELAGALVLTDGRHNRPSHVEDSARRFGILDAPLGVIAVGNPEPPRDAAVLAVRSPDAIHLGDKMRVSADLKFDGYKGRQATVRLTCDGALIEEKQITIPQDHHREEVRFIHQPEEGGTGGYQIEIPHLEGERFPDNNSWSFETSITEARTNVLLADDYPRWEFRYLRNLFYGRDKSVHLQWVLLHPDQTYGMSTPAVSASAARPFGQAAATRLPDDEAEWRKFDVIILGDLPPAAISANTWTIISRCVNERGALLVFIAGPNHMPHALDQAAARDLLPLDPVWSHRTLYGENNDAFRFSLTSEGRRHPVTQSGSAMSANAQTWASFPSLHWRHPVASVKEGAEVLLAAAPESGVSTVDDSTDVGSALVELSRRREEEAKRALLVTRQTGRGKVAALLTDRTWRLREGAGDVHHHRFWGNLVRWGAGPLLRSGSDKVALGTDQLTYTADDPVTVTARLRDADLNPVADPTLKAEILRDGKVVATVPLAAVEGSNGLHEGKAAPLRNPGIHQVRLVGKQASALLSAESKNSLTTSFRVVGARGPIELADTTPDRNLLESIASASGGKVVDPSEASTLLPLFLTEGAKREEIRETPLWDNAIIFTALACVLTAEWWLRRSAGLP